MRHTAKTISERLHTSLIVAIEIRDLIRGTVNPESSPDVQDWLVRCCHRPTEHELTMCAINDVLGSAGVEAIRSGWSDDQYKDIAATYCNLGDVHTTTVFRCNRREKFMLTSVASYVS